MKQLPEQLHALAATARIANIPSVASNICVGAAFALASGSREAASRLPLVIPAGICLYVAGNFLNDWADRDWDAARRPERALPRGMFHPGLYLATAASLSVLGTGLAAVANLKCLPVAAAIAALVILYTAVHKRSAWSVIPMGLCRALLPLLGFLACMGQGRALKTTDLLWIAAPGTALLCHVAGLSLSARHESSENASAPWMAWLLFLAAGCSAAAPAIWHPSLGGSADLTGLLLALAAFSLWILLCNTWLRKPASRHVSNLLAGIPLVDWMFILPLSGIAENTLPHAFVWLPPLAFLSAKALQRLAPAT